MTNEIVKKYDNAFECPISEFMDVFGGKWKPIIICLLFSHKTLRFNEFDKKISGISQKILTEQLKQLESLQVIIKTTYPTVPPKVEYCLSDKGMSLYDVFMEMKHWIENKNN